MDKYTKIILIIIAILLFLHLVVKIFEVKKVDADMPYNVNIESIAGCKLFEKILPVKEIK